VSCAFSTETIKLVENLTYIKNQNEEKTFVLFRLLTLELTKKPIKY